MVYDLIIIGGGPAGLTAGIYAKRAGLNVLIIEKYSVGGQVALTLTVDNYPGYQSVSGFELAEKMHKQAESLGAETVYADVIQTNLSGKVKKVVTNEGIYEALTVIIATGASAKKLGLAKETELTGRGVSYCATCDGAFFKDKVCSVVGGGNTALEDAMYLSKFAKKVYLIHRRDSFKADDILSKQLIKMCSSEGNCIQPIYNSVVQKIKGENKLEEVVIKNVKDNKSSTVKTDGLFIAIGRKPDTELTENQVEINKEGYIVIDENCKTSLSGVYAAGDVTNNKLKQIITACASGAIAANSAREYISLNN